MKFEKKIDELGISVIYMNIDDLTLPKLNFDIKPLLEFRVETYKGLKANGLFTLKI